MDLASVGGVAREALLDVRALLFPVECAGCAEPDRALCAGCRASLSPIVIARATTTGLRVHTALRYEGTVRSVVLALKEQGRTDVARALSPALALAIAAARVASGAATLVRVPRGRLSYRRRGYDPLALLLRAAGEGRARGLRMTRATAAQKALGLDDRARNLAGTMAARRDLHGAEVILVDDILTSGATLAEASRAVTEAGGRVLGAATMAFTPRWRVIRDIHHGEDYGGA